ncbi:MerR family transcriptional regulator [Aciditerrimonas ferrireducens]|uniref:MerR family transcriptional regulator n=1 Tax=Aciditerrimonas ferrireducens TaxID=667306 RepID=UPI002005387A|nr:MerR family transcriptional regulator [Aciditerrimonas ferrireducens]MCK4177850.1 MerR family transcriptional regulator [Aciditerrimonas ferrireducens]
MSGRSYLSIGDVLSLLQEEFPDVTISKIRFLESQGLVSPERTPSGYRKFYDEDVARLRWILRQQREHFLPLKVIKGRLEAAGGRPPELAEEDAPLGQPAEPAGGEDAPAVGPADPGVLPGFPPPVGEAGRAGIRGRAGTNGAAREAGTPRHKDPGLSEAGYSAAELVTLSGLEPGTVEALEAYGLLRPARRVAGEPVYDETGLAVARAAAGFARFGLEARHLRSYKHAAEREAGFVEQVVLPLLRQRNPEARQRARAVAEELVTLGQALHQALVAEALGDLLR